MARILLLEDDRALHGGLKEVLERDGHEVVSAFTCARARAAADAARPDEDGAGTPPIELYLLDISLPDGDGREFCRSVRSSRDTPVVFLTADDTDEDVVAGFALGCDDYISKPVSPAVLTSRVAAVLRRAGGRRSDDVFTSGGLSANFDTREVTVDGSPVKLTPREFDVLHVLIDERGRIVTRRALLEKIWDAGGDFVDDNTVSVTMRRLRKKLGEREYIKTVFGVGYMFADE